MKSGALHNHNILEAKEMTNENHTLTPAKIELLSNVSGAYTSPFWDGMREVTGTLDTIRKRDIKKRQFLQTGSKSAEIFFVGLLKYSQN